MTVIVIIIVDVVVHVVVVNYYNSATIVRRSSIMARSRQPRRLHHSQSRRRLVNSRTSYEPITSFLRSANKSSLFFCSIECSTTLRNKRLVLSLLLVNSYFIVSPTINKRITHLIHKADYAIIREFRFASQI